MDLEVGVHREGRIYPPVDETHIYRLKHQAESRVFLEVLEEPA